MKKIIIIIIAIIILLSCALLKTNTITFNYYTQIDNQIQEVSDTLRVKWYKSISFPSVNLDNYELDGWICENDLTYYTVPKNRNNFAYTAIIYPKVYSVNFFANKEDQNPIYSYHYEYGSNIPIEYKAPETETMSFLHWENINSEEVYCINNMTSGDVNLYVKYSPKVFNIVYNLNGGSFKDTPISQYTYGDSIQELPIPQRSQYTFKGWYSDSLFTTQVSSISESDFGDIVLYAKWKLNYTEGDYGRLTIGNYTAKLCSRDDPNCSGLRAQAICDLPDVCLYTTRKMGTLIQLADHNNQGFIAIKNNTVAKWTRNNKTIYLKRVSIRIGYNHSLEYCDDGTSVYDNPAGPILMYTCVPGQKDKVYITFWDYM